MAVRSSRPVPSTGAHFAAAAAAALVLAGARGSAAGPDAAAREDETREPPLLLTLDVEGEVLLVELDRPFTLEPAEAARTAVLRAEPYRVFPYAGIRFHYPSYMSFQADLAEPPPTWYLNGKDVLVIVQRYDDIGDPEVLLDLLVAGMRAYVGPDAHVAGDASITLGEREATGKVLELELLGSVQRQEVYAREHPGGGTIGLVLQDSSEFSGVGTGEFGDMKAMVAESFRFAPGDD